MFAINDKLVLSLVNIKNFDNEYINCSYTLPAEISENILNNIASIDVFEYHEGSINNGFVAFRIYVGEKGTLSELITTNKKIKINTTISSLDKPILYQIVDNNIIIRNELEENDIVVYNKDELKNVIDILSIEFQKLKKTITRIRTLK